MSRIGDALLGFGVRIGANAANKVVDTAIDNTMRPQNQRAPYNNRNNNNRNYDPRSDYERGYDEGRARQQQEQQRKPGLMKRGLKWLNDHVSFRKNPSMLPPSQDSRNEELPNNEQASNAAHTKFEAELSHDGDYKGLDENVPPIAMNAPDRSSQDLSKDTPEVDDDGRA